MATKEKSFIFDKTVLLWQEIVEKYRSKFSEEDFFSVEFSVEYGGEYELAFVEFLEKCLDREVAVEETIANRIVAACKHWYSIGDMQAVDAREALRKNGLLITSPS